MIYCNSKFQKEEEEEKFPSSQQKTHQHAMKAMKLGHKRSSVCFNCVFCVPPHTFFSLSSIKMRFFPLLLSKSSHCIWRERAKTRNVNSSRCYAHRKRRELGHALNNSSVPVCVGYIMKMRSPEMHVRRKKRRKSCDRLTFSTNYF